MTACGGSSGNVTDECSVMVVGGGINGAGIARDLAGRGVSVILCEKDDLASHTSSAATKLIHGGLRYLEHYEFGLVRKSLQERELLMRSAPHIIWPLRFLMPHDPSVRPAWMIRIGLFLYDHLARRELLPKSGSIDLRTSPQGKALRSGFTRGFVYSDGWVDDARLVVLNARDAADRGARILTRTLCTNARRADNGWLVSLRDAYGETSTVRASALVNASGPWAGSFLSDQLRRKDARRPRLIKGSHIVVPKLFDHDTAYILQSPDKRVIFAVPYEEHFTLIGTTDVEFTGDASTAAIDAAEVAYLCKQINRYFVQSIEPKDVVWSYSGVRPLFDDNAADPSAITRDYSLELETDGAPLLSVWGGKITTFRKLAEEASDLLLPALGLVKPHWTATAHLPGGDLSAQIGKEGRADEDFERFCAYVQSTWAFLPPRLSRRFARAYGSRVTKLLADVTDLDALGAQIAPGLFEREINYLIEQEWALDAEDVLWRRSKLGLHLSADQREALDRWMKNRLVARVIK